MTDRNRSPAGHGCLDRLVRWETAGGTWRVLDRSAAVEARPALTIALFRCDGGEEVERFTTAEEATLEFVADRESSED